MCGESSLSSSLDEPLHRVGLNALLIAVANLEGGSRSSPCLCDDGMEVVVDILSGVSRASSLSSWFIDDVKDV